VVVIKATVNLGPRKTFREHAYLRSLVNVDGTKASEAIFFDQLRLMTSIFLTYMAGVIPIPKSNQRGNINFKPIQSQITKPFLVVA
uniref:Uncharacterized protein n=1 Tax=Cucumis melo TaxID=3656 RepID=A0A9I9EMH0_CUCME